MNRREVMETKACISIIELHTHTHTRTHEHLSNDIVKNQGISASKNRIKNKSCE